MRDKRRMSANEFEALRPLMSISKDRQDAARMALVDGQTLQGIGNIYKLTRQAVGSSVSAVWKVYERWQESQRAAAAASENVPEGWERITIIAPSELIAKFKSEVAQAAGGTPIKTTARKSASQAGKKNSPA
ncbi:MAG: hypothetical protein EOP12_02175 [Pseudomonas sp.]|jgi:hypothetical protein|nr:MAG: hypothetical protein EOP12_02175 [Pseudomonas sp.]